LCSPGKDAALCGCVHGDLQASGGELRLTEKRIAIPVTIVSFNIVKSIRGTVAVKR
jgi:hypothetical protein